MATNINEFGLPNIVVPAEVFFNDNIGYVEKFLFSIINNLASNEHGYCWAGNAYLAKLMNLKKNTISIAISKLQDNEYITTEYSKRRSDGATLRKIHINYKYQEIYAETLRKKYKELNDFLHEEKEIKKPGVEKNTERISQASHAHVTDIKHPTHTHQRNIDSDIDMDLDRENPRFSLQTSCESQSPTRTRKRNRNPSSSSNSSNSSIKDKINGKKKELTAQSSKDSKNSKNKIPYNTKPNIDLIAIWNKQENLRSHTKTDSKTYKQSLKKLEMLRRGTIHKIINKDNLQDYISENHISKPWRKSDIAKAIKTLNEWCKEGNMPYKKEWLKRMSLADAIFCTQYGSPLISAFVTGVKPIYDPSKNLTDDEELFAYNKLEQFFLSNNGNTLNVKKKQQIVELIKSLKGLREEYSGNWKLRPPEDFGYGYTPNTLKSLVIDYYEFLKGEFLGSEFVPNSSLTPNGLKVGSYVWSQFEKAYRNRFGADPITGPEL